MLKAWILSLWQSPRFVNQVANVVLGIFISLMVLIGFNLLQRLPVFAVHSIEVIGLRGPLDLEHQNESYVRRAVLPMLKGNFFSVNVTHVQQVFMQVPWVRHATVRRVWPNRVLVVLEEHQPRAQLNEGLLVNSFGEVFVVQVDERSKSLPVFLGNPLHAGKMLVRLNELNQWLAPLNIETSALLLSDRSAWTARLSNQVTLELGRDELTPAASSRVGQWVKLWPALSEKMGTTQRIDLRYPNGFAVQAGNS